jgi:hypothetical protein
VPGEEADKGGADQETDDLDGAPGAAAQAVEHEADADHLAGLERVGEGQEGKGRHAPGGEVVARRDVEADLAADGEAHHENEDRDQEQPGEVAGGTIEAIEKGSDHEGYARLSVITMTGRACARKLAAIKPATARYASLL